MLGPIAIALSACIRFGVLAVPALCQTQLEAERLQREATFESPAPVEAISERAVEDPVARPAGMLAGLAAAFAAQHPRAAAQIEKLAALERERRRRMPHSMLDTADEEDERLAHELADAFDRLAQFQVAGGTQAAGGGGTPLPPGPPIGTLNYRTAEIVLYPPTPFVEPFLMQTPVPLPSAGAPRPLLIVFHKFGSSHKDVLQNTTFLREAAQRGWFLLCPLGASKKHFESMESQTNTEAVIDWFLPKFHVDTNRIYGVGFSMGGGSVTNFAARHLDPAHGMFAAIIDHSGGVALNNTYYNDPPARYIFDFWYGDGTAGSADPWKMTRSSVIDFDPVTLVVDRKTDLARNLLHIPLQIWRASSDPIPYVPTQCDVLDAHLQFLGLAPGLTYSYTVVPYTGHSWSMLDQAAACTWLSQFTLTMPTSAKTLADHDGVYFQFSVEQDAPGAFTPFTWSVLTATNELQLSDTANLKRITVDPVSIGLSTAQGLQFHLATYDGLADEIKLRNYPGFPSAVTRDTLATGNWTYDPATQELVLLETDGGAHDWLVVP
jgi:pimeloyl-ACP methyl ester carboxylesterase